MQEYEQGHLRHGGLRLETAHKADWPGMVKCDGGLEPHPNESAAFHADVFGHAAREAQHARRLLTAGAYIK